MSAFYSWALPRLDQIESNPVRDAGRITMPKARDRVLNNPEMAALWRVADGEAGPWGQGLKLLMLTGQRRDEVFQADRTEFDTEAKLWIIPADRAKNGVEHHVPLSSTAIAVLDSVPAIDGSDKLFPARGNLEAGVSGYSKTQTRFRTKMQKEFGDIEVPHWTLHDIRRTVATNLQRLGTRFEVTEALLNHVSGARGGIAGVYQRHDWKAEKRAALDAWAAELDRIVRGTDDTNVVKLERLMARPGRPRKAGPRNKRGKLIRNPELGTKRAQAMQERFGRHGADAIGRAFATGLLGSDNTALAMLDTGRKIARTYEYRFAVGRIRSPLGGSGYGGLEDVERAIDAARWLEARLDRVVARGPAVRSAFEELVIHPNADGGPNWLDRILAKQATVRDFSRLAHALEGLEAAL